MHILCSEMNIDNASTAGMVVSDSLEKSSAAWPDELWVESVGWCDSVLRSFYRIREFTEDPDCVFRVGLGKARKTLLLSDGTIIRGGETVGTVHLWNEHLPRLHRHGLGWACAMHHRVVHSLAALAMYVETAPAWREIPAFHAESGLSTRLRSLQIERVVQRYGFENAVSERSLLRRVHDLGDDFLLWGLARAFNPEALSRSRFFRDHQDLWISRSSLLRHHLSQRQPNVNRAASLGGA
jgi:hypothetical protein